MNKIITWSNAWLVLALVVVVVSASWVPPVLVHVRVLVVVFAVVEVNDEPVVQTLLTADEDDIMTGTPGLVVTEVQGVLVTAWNKLESRRELAGWIAGRLLGGLIAFGESALFLFGAQEPEENINYIYFRYC
jgi:hypothetical protein